MRALAVDKRVFGAEHSAVATDLNNLARLYSDQDKYSEAEPLYVRSLQILKQSLGPHHLNTQRVRQNYADLLRAMGRNEEAKQLEEGNEN